MTYSVEDIIQGELEVEQEVNVILGGTSDQKCTYEQGYLYRQPVFVCLTCSPNETGEGGKYPGGICLACSLKCHSSHKVEELYTKRNFRCDCGNQDKFGHLKDGKCQLNPEKSEFNEGNVYGDNFLGLYCTCKKIFDGEEEMIQCVLCEDWYHLEHCGLGTSEGIGELVCPSCMAANHFLFLYTDKTKMEECSAKIQPKTDEKDEIRTENPGSSNEIAQKSEDSLATSNSKPSETNSLKRKSESTEINPKRLKTETETETKCQLQTLTSPPETGDGQPGIFTEDWRQSLCRCEDCLSLYRTKKIEFLLQDNDTITYYENQAKSTDSFSNGVDAFSEMMSPLQKTEMLYQFNNLKEEFTDFFRPFANEGKIITKEDIQKFFEELNRKKERNKDAGIPPENCKL